MLSRSVVPGLWFALAVLVAACAGHDTASSRDATDARFAAAHGTSLLDPKGLGAFVIQGDEKRVAVSTVAVTGQPFTQALHAEIKVPSGTDYSVQVAARTVAPVAKGDAVLASFFVRALPGPERDAPPESALVFERAGDPYTKSLNYTFKVGPAWRQVRIPFVVAEDYPAGGAQIIFRLGYDPEILEFGGVVVDNYGKQVTTREMPRTDGADWALATELGKAYADKPVVITDGGAANIEVDPGTVIGPISPYVYGINAQRLGAVNTTIRRMGGNRQTGYNWELNASNAGADYRHISDQWPCTVQGFSDCDRPGAQILDFARADHDAGVETIMTLPMVDYVTADTKGAVPESQAAPSPRWVKSLPKKGAPFVEQPDLGDGVVYQDELVNLLVKRLGRADAGGVRFYALDNELMLWNSTHRDVHPDPVGYDEAWTRTADYAAAIRSAEPDALITGPVTWGYCDLFGSAKDNCYVGSDRDAHGGLPFVAWYLQQVCAQPLAGGARAIDYLDLHYYPQGSGVFSSTDDAPTSARRLAALRELWDPAWVSDSWIADLGDDPVWHYSKPGLLPRVHAWIDQYCPGTKLAISEYNWGGDATVSGAVAQAELFGIFARDGVDLAARWVAPASGSQVEKALLLLLDYDGAGGGVRGRSAAATSNAIDSIGAYAFRDVGHHDFVLLTNKDTSSHSVALTFAQPAAGSCTLYQFDAFSAVHAVATACPSGTQATIGPLPARSASLLVLADADAIFRDGFD
jgi:hypothetical protein